MKKLVAFLTVPLLCVALTGCPSTSTNQGTKDNPPKANKNNTNTNTNTADGEKSLEVKAPDSVTLKQGDSENVKISVTRKPASFDEDVHITFEGLPTGVTVAPADGKISKASNDGTFTLRAADDAGEVSNAGAKIVAKSGDKTVNHNLSVTIKKK